ncbi:MFS general substrate transporter [Dothidotthia symphoricarpi CBS 119687]|uniref:MFS general substrate transporter n=1 Tax=Dothidotthia symphoricarpi CBS 119687 TaxID=1392245 RepID=A0A6A6AUM7_9PLEO|nr:MFS general substrate transporter [Dothidotthia symphoricarpi CBS 119687]KAF2134251.1 MFS general substrate transporter [Dothidotthia symphoricarpi CBS 119687]
MATPASLPNPVRDTQDLKDEKAVDAYQHGHDADLIPPPDVFNQDLEKGAHSHANSVHSGERTLTSEAPVQEEERDPDIVDWDGPDDPQNPQNWTAGKKWQIIAALGFITLITPLASSFFAPGVPHVLAAFNETSKLMATFVVSVYILGFAIGPLIIAPLSELYGRMLLYNICNVLFIVFNIGCAASNSMGMLIAFRLLAGCAGSCPLTIGGGTVSDMFPLQQRAGAMAIYSIGPLLGPVIGPVCGGFLVETASWRWVFWILAIAGGISGISLYIVGRETYATTILERKAARLRKETGNPNLRSKLASGLPAKEIFIRAITRPMKMLFLSPIVGLMALYVAINYGILYLFFTTMTFTFVGTYHFSSGASGVSFVGIGVGMMVGMAAMGIMSDKLIKKAQANGEVITPEHRLPIVLTLPGAISMPIGIFIYGWSAYYGVHWIVPIIGTAFIGVGNLTALMTIQTYLVDAFTVHAASAIAANTVLRSIFGAVLPLIGLDMYDALGLGWGNSLLGFIALAFIPVPVLFKFYGQRIRTNPRFRINF